MRSLVSVAGVWGGTARAVKVFAVGDNLDSWFLNEKNLLWERTNPSLAWLMPSADFWTDDEVNFNYTNDGILSHQQGCVENGNSRHSANLQPAAAVCSSCF